MKANEKKGMRRKEKKSKKAILYILLILVMLGVLGWHAVDMIILRMDYQEIKMKNEQLKLEKEKLEAELEYINSKDYIEQQARDQLKMVMPGEIVYVQEDKNED